MLPNDNASAAIKRQRIDKNQAYANYATRVSDLIFDATAASVVETDGVEPVAYRGCTFSSRTEN
jgi:hypothetical protein